MYEFILLNLDLGINITWVIILVYSLYNIKNVDGLLKLSILILCMIMLFNIKNYDTSYCVYLFNKSLVLNNLIECIKLYILFLVVIILIQVYAYIEHAKLQVLEFIVLVIISVQGLYLIIAGNDLIIIFLGIELQSFCCYILVGMRKNSNLGIEAALKYFVLSAYSNMVSLLGISLLYGYFGTIKLNEIKALVSIDDEILHYYFLGVICLFVSIFFKIALFAFHYWIADIYHGALIIVTAFFAIVPKVAYIVLFFKLYAIFYIYLQNICLIIAFLSILYGTIRSLYEQSVRRFIAFSSMTHIGYIILGISLNTIEGIVASFFYLFYYTMFIIFFFCFLLCFVEKRSNGEIGYIDDLSSFNEFSKKNHFLSVMFATILLSMAGLPFLAGFYSKWYIFVALISTKNYLLTFLLLIISVLSSIYYIRLVRFMFFSDTKDERLSITFIYSKRQKILIYLLILIFFLNISAFFFHDFVYLIIENLILSLK